MRGPFRAGAAAAPTYRCRLSISPGIGIRPINDGSLESEVMVIIGAASGTATLSDVVRSVRAVVRQERDWETTSLLVAGRLRAHLPGPEILTEASAPVTRPVTAATC